MVQTPLEPEYKLFSGPFGVSLELKQLLVIRVKHHDPITSDFASFVKGIPGTRTKLALITQQKGLARTETVSCSQTV